MHDQLELAGWDVRIADAQREVDRTVGLQDRLNRRLVLAELARHDLVPSNDVTQLLELLDRVPPSAATI